MQFSDCLNGVYGSSWYHGTYREALATAVVVRAGQATSRIDGGLTVGGAISGKVTGPSARPANGTCVEAYDPASQSFGFASTDKAGRYTIPGLSNGRYSLYFSACFLQSPNLASVILDKKVQVVAPHARAGVSIKLAAGGSVTGTITGPSGPQSQACVLAVPTNPRDGDRLVWANGSGRYRIAGLAAGTYRVEFGDPTCDIYDLAVPALAQEWYDDQPGPSTATPVSAAAGQVTEGVSGMLPPFGGIDGTVMDQGHAGVAGECVTAVPFQAAADPFTGLAPAPDVAITGPSGRYRLLDLPPGQYKIEFSTGCGDAGFATQWWDDVSSASSATVVRIGDATTGGIDANLRR